MKKLSKEEIEAEQKIYDTNFGSLECGHDYMAKTGFSHGGWQMVARMGRTLSEICKYIREVISGSPTSDWDFDDLLQITPAPLPKDLQFRLLPDVCFELSNEGFQFQWDPSQIRNYFKRHPECFEGTFIYVAGPAKKEINKYSVDKEKLVKDMAIFPHQNSIQKKIFSEFSKWRCKSV